MVRDYMLMVVTRLKSFSCKRTKRKSLRAADCPPEAISLVARKTGKVRTYIKWDLMDKRNRDQMNNNKYEPLSCQFVLSFHKVGGVLIKHGLK